MDKIRFREVVLLDPFNVFPRETKRVVSYKIGKEREQYKQQLEDQKLEREIWEEDRRLQKLESMNEHFKDPNFADRHTLTLDDSEWRNKYADQYLWLISE